MMTEEIEKIDFFQTKYDQNHILSKCDDIILEAKRVLLNEQLDKIANITLSEVNNSRKSIENCVKHCKDSLNWENETFWRELPHPKKPLNNVKNEIPNAQNESAINNVISNLMKITTRDVSKPKVQVRNNELMYKYFNIWKKSVKMRKEKLELKENKIEQKEKLDKFIKQLKKCKKQEEMKCFKESECKDISKELKPSSNYKNRFIAQKTIIDMQKAKLEEQNKVIKELQLGIIRDDLLKSIASTKIEIREIFKNCSEKLKCTGPVIFIEEKQQFMINSQKAPKVVQQMEQRALQRAHNRQIILERKRLIEDERQKMLEEIIENKRVLEEEEKRKNLEAIKERRKKELELEKIRQAKKQQYLQNLNKAIKYHNTLLTTKCFKKLYNDFRESKENELMASNHYDRKLLEKNIYCWCEYIEDKYRLKYQIADAHFAYNILKKTLKIWHERKVRIIRDFSYPGTFWSTLTRTIGVLLYLEEHIHKKYIKDGGKDHIENIRNMQVAEDFFDFRLTSNIFTHWYRYVCTQIVLQYKRTKIAEIHYKRKITFHYFYLWRSLPAVIQLEKAKELKKRKWREKVWEILPDYKPPEDI